jgi:hypothetical protein
LAVPIEEESRVFSVDVIPESTLVHVGDSVRFAAEGRDSLGTIVGSWPAYWSTADSSIASVNNLGIGWGVAPGVTRVSATIGSRQGFSTLVVEPPIPVAAVIIRPGLAKVPVGDFSAFTAIAIDSSGNVLRGRAASWVTGDTLIATVDPSGLVTPLNPGTTTIRVDVQGHADSALLTVTDPVLVGAGDIASCSSPGDEATAQLLDTIPGAVFAAGDNAYESGTIDQYRACYAPSWGRHLRRTHPAPGNHEYYTSGAQGYYAYFGSLAGDPTKGYYSYELGSWHIVVLNSAVEVTAGSPQDLWLRADLAGHSASCTLAYLHHPRFNSGEHGSDTTLRSIWQALYDSGADVVVSAHEHIYERFAPQKPDGTVDPARGIRQFTVGTGGKSHHSYHRTLPNSEVQDSTSFGVLKLTLHASGYDWRFVPVAGQSFTDLGSSSCH